MHVLRCDEIGVRGDLDFERVGLFDRDGVLNVDHGYVFERDQFEWVAGANEVLGRCYDLGIGLGVITNQSGIGRGYYSEQAFLDLMHWVGSIVPIDLVIYCPHAPEAHCPGRKPGVRMVQMALNYFGVEGSSAFLIGDKETDIVAANRAGVISARFEGGDLREAVKGLGIF